MLEYKDKLSKIPKEQLFKIMKNENAKDGTFISIEAFEKKYECYLKDN